MADQDVQLGLYSDNGKLFFAAARPSTSPRLTGLGSVDFQTDPVLALLEGNDGVVASLAETLEKLIQEHRVSRVCFTTPASLECWSMVPKPVHDDQEEWLSHLDILMRGSESEAIETRWFELSNRDFRLVSIRDHALGTKLAELVPSHISVELRSEFELGTLWMSHSQFHGSFLTISAANNVVSICSYMLGKLRAATYFAFEDTRDIPYLWLQHTSHLPWIEGMHEYIIVYGDHSEETMRILDTFLKETPERVVMNSLKKMNIAADEETYPFPLERSFPATLLAVT